jgi:Ca2+-binding RTX toxin-like protein
MLLRLVAFAAVPAALALSPAAASAVVTTTVSDGVLTATGDTADDTIALTAPSAGQIAVGGSAFARAAVSRVVLLGGGGADTITVADGLRGVRVDVRGGPGADTITGGASDETFLWQPGDGSDAVDGGAGDDRLDFSGANIAESLALLGTATPGQVRLTRDVASVALDLTRIEHLSIQALGGADTFAGATGVADRLPDVTVDGGAGTDTLTGGDGDDTLIGGPDADTLSGGDGDDRFLATPADAAGSTDAIDGGPGSDTLWVTGTDARDVFQAFPPGVAQVSVSHQASGVTITATAERVAIDALGGDDEVSVPGPGVAVDVRGGDGDDLLTGGDVGDRLDGGPGDDALSGLGGADTLLGGPGADTLFGGADGDRFGCTAPGDRVLDAGSQDTVDADCGLAVPPPPAPVPPPPSSTVTLIGPPPAAPPADLRAPALTLRGLPATIKRAALLKSGLSVRVAVDERAALSGELLSVARSARIAAAAPNLTLATKTAPLAPGTRTLTLRPSRKLVGGAKRFTLTVRVTATDAAGNRRTATRRVKVR